MAQIQVEVIRAGPQAFTCVRVPLPEGACVADAVAASGIDQAGIAGFAIHGELATPATPVRDGDRVELLRPLLADPKDARRRRAAR